MPGYQMTKTLPASPLTSMASQKHVSIVSSFHWKPYIKGYGPPFSFDSMELQYRMIVLHMPLKRLVDRIVHAVAVIGLALNDGQILAA